MGIYFIPFISAFIGWFSIWIAVKMLFHPRKPIRFPGFTLQGIFPKKQQQIAEQLGALAATELLHFDEIMSKLNNPELLKTLSPTIHKHLDTFLQVKLQEKLPIISTFVGESTLAKIKEAMMEEIELLLPEIITQYTYSIGSKANIQQLVADKFSGVSTNKLEEIFEKSMSRELRFTSFFAAVLGFLIGIIQFIIIV